MAVCFLSIILLGEFFLHLNAVDQAGLVLQGGGQK